MTAHNNFNPYKNFNKDLPASIVVFLVAVPLCLGIALASGAPLFSGLIAGMVGGIVVGALSGSHTGVSGPAAGLAVIVLSAIEDLGSFEIFLMAVVLAGVIQLVLGYLQGGIIAYYFPSSVVTGMLSGIGIIIFLKQLPHAIGYDKDPEGDLRFFQPDDQNTLSELINMLDYMSPGPIIITLVGLAILLLWETKFVKRTPGLNLLPGPLLAVIAGSFLNLSFRGGELALGGDQMVSVPTSANLSGFLSNFSMPDFSALLNYDVYVTAIIIAVVASLETLLCVEATDKLDPHKRVTPTNKELKAQGVGNIVSGLIGGLPITQVIVRSSANIQAGSMTKTSAVAHGLLLLLSIIFIPDLLNTIPLSSLAAILLVVGYKLAKPAIFKQVYSQGRGQFVPYVVTIVGIIFTDLLVGLGIGLVVAIFFVLYNNYRIPFRLAQHDLHGKAQIRIDLAQEVTFLNKATILRSLSEIPDEATVTIDASNTYYMHHDVTQIIEDFSIRAAERDIKLNLVGLYDHKKSEPMDHISITTEEEAN